MNKIIYYDGELHVLKSGVYRVDFRRTFSNIETVNQFKATLRAGQYTWPGGYQLAFYTFYGEKMCFDCARKNAKLIMRAITDQAMDDCTVIGCEVIYEGRPHCVQCDREIVGSYEEN